MYPRHFFERFWESEQKNQLFVGMPLEKSLDSRFSIIDKSVQSVGFEKAFRGGVEKEANSITDRIFDGIANYKMLLFDLSDDPRTNSINLNVIYELGIANAIREPFDIILIRKESENPPKLPFDIQGLYINFFVDEVTEEFIKTIISSASKNQEWHKSKRVKIAAQSVDDIGLDLMYNMGWKPEGFNHFNSENLTTIQKLSVLRLIDLGILRFSSDCYPDRKGYETAYWWTPFGYEVMKHLRIQRMTLEEFKKTSEYEKEVQLQEQFSENKKRILGDL